MNTNSTLSKTRFRSSNRPAILRPVSESRIYVDADMKMMIVYQVGFPSVTLSVQKPRTKDFRNKILRIVSWETFSRTTLKNQWRSGSEGIVDNDIGSFPSQPISEMNCKKQTLDILSTQTISKPFEDRRHLVSLDQQVHHFQAGK